MHLGRHLLGATASYEITPMVTGRLAAIYSLSDDSCQVQPTLTVSMGDNLEMLFGAAWGIGAKAGAHQPGRPGHQERVRQLRRFLLPGVQALLLIRPVPT